MEKQDQTAISENYTEAQGDPAAMSMPKAFGSSTPQFTSTKDGSYVKSGIGGIGNFHKISDTAAAPPRPQASQQTTGAFFTGIGGLGNRHKDEERPIVSCEEIHALQALERENRSTIWHHGIGGVGNLASTGAQSVSSSSYSYPMNTSRSGADKMKDILFRFFKGKAKSNTS